MMCQRKNEGVDSLLQTSYHGSDIFRLKISILQDSYPEKAEGLAR